MASRFCTVASCCSLKCPCKETETTSGTSEVLHIEAELPVVEQIRQSIKNLTEARGPTKSICPSEVCRKVFPASCWRYHMPLVREVGFSLAEEGTISVSQRNQIISPTSFRELKGPIRFRKNFV